MVAWVTAALCGLVGLPSGWTIAVTVLVTLAVSWPLYTLGNALRDRAGRRRLGPPAPRAVSPPTGTAPGSRTLPM